MAERYFHDDPPTALIKLRQFAELYGETEALNFAAIHRLAYEVVGDRRLLFAVEDLRVSMRHGTALAVLVNELVIARSSMKTALWVKEGPPLVPAVNPTTVNTSGPEAVISWICCPIWMGLSAPPVSARSEPELPPSSLGILNG